MNICIKGADTEHNLRSEKIREINRLSYRCAKRSVQAVQMPHPQEARAKLINRREHHKSLLHGLRQY